jgi:hypothetical protein
MAANICGRRRINKFQILNAEAQSTQVFLIFIDFFAVFAAFAISALIYFKNNNVVPG